jgi:hypothetical protein
VAGLQRWDDALKLAEALEAIERLVVCDGIVLGALGVAQVAVFRADAGVVQAARVEGCACVCGGEGVQGVCQRE